MCWSLINWRTRCAVNEAATIKVSMRGAWAHASRACSDLARKCLRPTCSASTRGAELHSDIDVAVYIDEAHKDLSAFGLRAELSTLLMEGLQDNSVDLPILNDAPRSCTSRAPRRRTRSFAGSGQDDDAGGTGGFPILRLRPPACEDGSGAVFCRTDRIVTGG